jgi:tetratricopeptide (TPR) repeat protein
MDGSNTPVQSYDRAVENLAQACADSAVDLGASLEAVSEALRAGTTLAELKGMTGEECEAAYEAVAGLISEGRHQEALPAALMLAAHMPGDGRFSFAAACCLRRAGEPRLAAPLFALSLQVREDPATVYQLGECWAAVGQHEEAARCFDAVQLFCDDDEHDDLARRAREAAGIVRAQA